MLIKLGGEEDKTGPGFHLKCITALASDPQLLAVQCKHLLLVKILEKQDRNALLSCPRFLDEKKSII